MVESTQQSSPSATEILTIEDLSPTLGIVRIDGETYDLANTRAFSLRETTALQRPWRRIQELEELETEKISEDDELEYEKRLREVAAIALPQAPATVLAKLQRAQIGDIVVAFFAWAAKNNPRIRMARLMTSRTGSPASNGSTAATR